MKNAIVAAAMLLAFTALSSPAMAGLSLGGGTSGNAGVSLGGVGVGAGVGAGVGTGVGANTGAGIGADGSAGISARGGAGLESGGTISSLHQHGGKTRAELEEDVYGGADSVLGTAGQVEGQASGRTALPGIGADADANAAASGKISP